MNEVIEFTVIVPVYKSKDSLEPIVIELTALFHKLNRSFEILFVEDAGLEESWQELLRLKEIYKNQMTIVRLSKNYGQNGATQCGIDLASGKIVMTIDDDLEVRPSELEKLIVTYDTKKHSVIYGRFENEHKSFFVKIGSKILKRLFKSSEGATIGSSVRLISENIVDHLRNHSQDHLFINQIISWYTTDIQSVEIESQERKEGKSGYSFMKLLKIGLNLIFHYSSIPIKIMIFLAFAVAFGLVALLVYYVVFHLKNNSNVDLFMISVLISMTVMSGSIGVFGIYINRIYSSRVRKPNYAIKIKI